MTGHECWMAGASEVVYSMLMMQNDFVAPNINFEEPDDDTKTINIITTAKNIVSTVFIQFIRVWRHKQCFDCSAFQELKFCFKSHS